MGEDMALNRTLGYWEEQLFFECPRRCRCTMVVHLNVNAGSEVNVNKFEKAVSFLPLRQPHLNVNVDITASPKRYKPATDFSDIFEHINMAAYDEAMWSKMCHDEMNRDFIIGGEQPLFKVILVQAPAGFCVMMAGYHHSVGDGTSGYRIVHDVLSMYHQLLDSPNDEMKVERLAPFPSMEEAAAMAVGEPMSAEDRKECDHLKSESLKRLQNYKPFLPYDIPDNNPDYLNRAVWLDGTPDGLKQVLARCKAEGITIGIMLMGAQYFALAATDAVFRRTEGQTAHVDYQGMKDEIVYVPVSMRSRVEGIGHGNEVFAFFITEIIPKIPFIGLDTCFWDLCKEVGKQVKDAMARRHHFLYSQAKVEFEAEHADALAKMATGTAGDLLLSSKGKYPWSTTYDTMMIDKIYNLGSRWVPYFSNYLMLISSTNIFTYTLIYDYPGTGTGDLNKTVAHKFAGNVRNVVEGSHSFDTKFTLGDFLKKFESE